MKHIFLILLLSASPCFGATTAQLVQCKSQYFANPPQSVGGTITLNQTVSAGDGIVAVVLFGSVAASASATDNLSDSYTVVTGYPKSASGNWNHITKLFNSNIAAGNLSITVKLNVQDYFEFMVCEVAQQSRSAMIDQNATATGTASSISSGSVTTAQADLVIGYINAFNTTITLGGGFTSQVVTTGTQTLVESLIQGAGGAVAATGTSTASSWVADVTTIAPISTTALSSIAVTPASPSAGAGVDTQFTATGTYTDTSTSNLSSLATWSSSNTNAAVVNSVGLATGVRAGSTTIQGSYNSINGTTTFTVTSSTPYTADDFLGFINAATNCSGHPQAQSFTTGSQSGTTQTVTVTDGTKFAVNEMIMLSGTSTAMDYAFVIKNSTAGASKITNIAGNVITLTALNSATVTGPTSGTFTPAYFYRQLVNSRWELCTPENHWLFSQGVSAADVRAVGTKYSSACQAGDAEMRRFLLWNFNGTYEDSNEVYDPTNSFSGNCPSNRKFPSIPLNSDSNNSVYASNNTFGYLSQPIQNLDNGTTSNYPGCPYHRSGSGMIDYFDSRWATFSNNVIAQHQGSASQSPFSLNPGMLDDTDGVQGVGAGPNFKTGITPAGDIQNCNSAWIVMNTAPVQAGSNFAMYGSAPYLYPDPLIYSKIKAASTPANCTFPTNICTLRDYFFNLYGGNITNLNSSEGTGGKYDTFDSDGVCIGWNFSASYAASACGSGNGSTAASIGTGDGNTLTFTPTALHTNVDKFSLGIFVNGVMVAADCPREANNCGSVAGSGNIIGANLTGGSINYSTGAITVVFKAGQAPTNGAAITANYIYNGFGYCGVLAHCGLMDQDGVSTWQGTNGICLVENPCASGAQKPANAQATFGADLDGWVVHFWGTYFSTVANSVHTSYPGMLYWGIDNVGSWSSPPNKGVLIAANQYVDVLFAASFLDTIDDPQTLAKYDFVTQYYNGPIVNFAVMTTLQTPTNNCQSNEPCFTTQATRANSEYHIVSDLLNQKGHTGNYQLAGWTHWGSHDFQTSGFGYMTALDNSYNGAEDVVASVSCSAPISSFQCGGENASANFLAANGLTGTFSPMTGNALWFGGAATPTAATPTASPIAGTYATSQNVSLSTTSPGAVICWNTTGAPGTNNASGCNPGSTLYSGPISVTSTETIYAVAGGTGFTDSPVGAFLYTITISPVPAPSGGGSPSLIILAHGITGCQLVQPVAGTKESQICKDAGTVPCLVCM